MITFQGQVTMAQQLTGDYTPATKLLFQRDINEGGAVFLNGLGRKFNEETLSGDLKSQQQYYQLSSEVLRVSSIRTLNGNIYLEPQLITSEAEWNALNSIKVYSNWITYYFIRGFNEVGLFPIPNTDTTDGIIISFLPQHTDLTQDDFTSGTVTVSNGSQTITHSAAGFTQGMVGRWFQITDGTDSKWYRIGSFLSASQLNLENDFEGVGGSGRSFLIGEVMKIPQGYQDAPVYYACERFYMAQNDQRTAPLFNQRFLAKLRSAKETYGRSTSQMAVKRNMPPHAGRGWIDFTKPVTYP